MGASRRATPVSLAAPPVGRSSLPVQVYGMCIHVVCTLPLARPKPRPQSGGAIWALQPSRALQPRRDDEASGRKWSSVPSSPWSRAGRARLRVASRLLASATGRCQEISAGRLQRSPHVHLVVSLKPPSISQVPPLSGPMLPVGSEETSVSGIHYGRSYGRLCQPCPLRLLHLAAWIR